MNNFQQNIINISDIRIFTSARGLNSKLANLLFPWLHLDNTLISILIGFAIFQITFFFQFYSFLEDSIPAGIFIEIINIPTNAAGYTSNIIRIALYTFQVLSCLMTIDYVVDNIIDGFIVYLNFFESQWLWWIGGNNKISHYILDPFYIYIY